MILLCIAGFMSDSRTLTPLPVFSLVFVDANRGRAALYGFSASVCGCSRY